MWHRAREGIDRGRSSYRGEPVDQETSAPAIGDRKRGPKFLVGFLGVALIALIAGIVVLGNVYMPITEGSGSGPDNTPSSRFARSDADPFGTGTMFVYCSAPDTTFAWFISLRNNGPLPLTVLAGEHGPYWIPQWAEGNGFWLVDLAGFRDPAPATTPIQSHGWTDPVTAPTLTPTTLNPGDEVEVWARFRTGRLSRGAGTFQWIRSIWVRYSVLGIERTAEVPLRDGVGLGGQPCAA